MLGESLLQQDQFKKKQQKLFQQQKKFRNLEADKKYFADQTINLIKKQKMTMEKLKKENQALKQLIAKVNNERNLQNINGISLENMKETLQEIDLAIRNQEQTQKNIDKHIDNFQKKIIQKRKNCYGINSGTENQSNLQKQIKILQNRLDKANQKFNQTIAINKDLKTVIDSLRRQRVIFDNLYQKLEKELHQKRKKMADIIERANNAYEERDKANGQMQVLKQQARKQASQFQRQIKQISHLMEKIKLSSFVKKAGEKNFDQISNYYEIEPNTEAKNTKYNSFLNRQSKKSTQQTQKVQKFRQDFAKIQAATQIQNFDELLRIFSQNQEKNFQMFKFVNLQCNQIQQLQIEVQKLTEELEIKKPNQISQGKEKLIEELENKYHYIQTNLNIQENKYKTAQRQVKSLGVQIQKIFETLQCDREIAKEIGGSKTISQTNILVFLAIIQHKALQIINTFKQLSHPNMLTGYQKTMTQQPALLTFQDFQDHQQYDKILTFEELRKKAADFIQKQQGLKQKKKQIKNRKK